jgi:Na+-translocating ferredoxin:NAD+ oxidoreductase RnfA subunit
MFIFQVILVLKCSSFSHLKKVIFIVMITIMVGVHDIILKRDHPGLTQLSLD